MVAQVPTVPPGGRSWDEPVLANFTKEVMCHLDFSEYREEGEATEGEGSNTSESVTQALSNQSEPGKLQEAGTEEVRKHGGHVQRPLKAEFKGLGLHYL
jgi:hypothetical protein